MDSYIPQELREYIADHVGHNSYEMYVLDRQTAADDWHDVVVVECLETDAVATHFIMNPERRISIKEL